MNRAISSAIEEWSNILQSPPQKNVRLTTPDKTPDNCIAIDKKIIAILYPVSVNEIKACLTIAIQYKIPLYPVSTGNNWGYGSPLPVTENCAILNLSKMTKIINFDPETGIITLEPGVTQRQLAHFLDENNYAYLIPVTGAGPDCSILGNAIERGYGITPYADHFSSMMSLEAVLADGSIYKPMLSQLGNSSLDSLYKWGIGPYIDGLFTQSNFGIVTQMTICLAPKPKRVEAFFFSVRDTDDFQNIILKIKKVLGEFQGITGSINLMNQHRVLAMTEVYPKENLLDGLIPDAKLKQMASHRQIMLWTGVGALYGNTRVIKAVKKEIRKILKPEAKRLVFLTQHKTQGLLHLINKIPKLNKSIIQETFDTLNKTLQLFTGRPSEIALPLAYWISGKKPSEGEPMKPDKDGCGLIWYSPLVPMQADKVVEFSAMVIRICKKHKIEPLITLTSISDRCFDSTIPILFDKTNETSVRRAQQCYDELFDTGRHSGFVPYRLGVQAMHKLTQYQSVPDFNKKIKAAIDPHNIIAPGRYSTMTEE